MVKSKRFKKIITSTYGHVRIYFERCTTKGAMWQMYQNGFISYLMLEKGMSDNSIQAYTDDVNKLMSWVDTSGPNTTVKNITYKDLTLFIHWLNELGLGDKSQARIISGIKAFFKYLLLENVIQDDPSELLEGPKLRRKIPDVLSYNEIEMILNGIDLSDPQGQRNRAIIETLYACGLRVSELVNMRLSEYYPDLGLVKVIGKNNKERIVPIGDSAIKYNEIYVTSIRNHMKSISPGHEDFLFLNRRGKQLTRVMIFTIIKQAVADAGITKIVSPHTFRHSFATHLVEGGADLKAVQDMLGHESITTTEIYTHLDTQYLRDAIMTYHPRNKK